MRTRLPLLIALLVTGCARLDANEPIYLVPEAAFPYWAIGDLKDAADDWNLDVGTRLEVINFPPAHSQAVPVRASQLLCGFWTAEVTYTSGVELRACPSTVDFALFRHELGHVLNIRDHGGSVMASGRSPDDFTDEDRQIFGKANPGFIGQGGCAMVRRLGRVLRPPRLTELGGRVVALLPGTGQLTLQPLDESNALPNGEAVGLPIGPGADPLLFRTARGIGLIWTELGRAQVLRIDGNLMASGFGVLPLSGLGERRLLRAALELDGVLLLLVEDRQRATAELYRVDRPELSGEARLLHLETGVVASQLTGRLGRASLVTVREDGSAGLVEVDTEGRVGPTLALPGESWGREPIEQLPAIASNERGELFVLSNRLRVSDLHGQEPASNSATVEEDGPGSVERVFTEVLRIAPDLDPSAAQSLWVELPPDTHPSSALALTTISTGVIVTLTAARPLSNVSQTRDVYVMRLDAAPLHDSSGWQRISAPQGAWANAGSLVSLGDKLVAIWYDGLLRLDAQAKSRCVFLK